MSTGLKARNKWILLLILFVGLVLRFNKLGAQSFWFDEAGVAMAAVSPTLSGALEVVRSHAAAMPLDYFVAWMMAHVSLDEGWLRLPSAIWGILTLFVGYKFYRQIANERASLISVLFLAISPMLIYYSQELRFYAPLCFFYLFVTWLVLIAFRDNVFWSWAGAAVAGIIGFYFHIYVVFAFLNGILIWWFVYRRQDKQYLLIRNLAITVLCVFLACLPGYLYFAVETKLDYPFSWKLIIQLMVGMGWLPIYFTSAGVVFSLSCGLLTIASWRKAILIKNGFLIALASSVLIQIAIITLIDIGMSYFVASRQFIILLPLNLFFIGWFISDLWDRKNALIAIGKKAVRQIDYSKVNQTAAVLLIVILAASALLTDISDQNHPKSEGRQISEILHSDWASNSKIYVIPWFEPLLYQYYLRYGFNDGRIDAYFSGINWEDFSILANDNTRTYLITPSLSSINELDIILKKGFSPYPRFGFDNSPQILWVRN